MPMRSFGRQEREVFRYYQPDEDKLDINADGSKVRRASIDPILTAFAQLGALRLNAKRGIITLSTNISEFMLAESGQALSLQKDNDERDELWHGVGMLKCPTSEHTTVGSEMVNHFFMTDAKYLVLPDLTKDEVYKHKCVVVEHPHVRFIATAPLKTPGSGIVIGNYIVADDKPRDGLSDGEIEFIIDMGVTVMDYLEAGLVKKKQYRAERMIKGVSLFIEGKSTLRDWWIECGHRMQRPAAIQRSQNPIRLEEQANAEFGIQEPVNNLSEGLNNWPEEEAVASLPQSPTPRSASPRTELEAQHQVVDIRDNGRPMLPRRDDQVISSASGTQSQSRTPLASRSDQDRNSSVTTLVSRSDQDRNSSVTTLDTLVDGKEQRSSISYDSLPAQFTNNDELPKALQDALFTGELKGVFSRASNLIREAIAVQGVVFYDAGIGAFGAGSERDVVEEKAPGQFQLDQATDSEDETSSRLSAADIETNGHTDSELHSSKEHEPEKTCNILGFSTRHRSSLRGHRPPEEFGKLPESIMRRLLKKYPHGKIFNFGEDGSFAASDSDNCTTPGVDPAGPDGLKANSTEARSKRTRRSKEAEAKAIIECLPGARSVFWFPLWDQSRDRWFLGSLIWSTSATRIMCPMEDLTYLASFGNSTMAEVARISAKVLDKMKSDFISSISHELRSPLHGVLASVEFLQETQMTETQEDMVNNIHASGNVLLDTINHVLDFSKVNKKSKNRTSFAKHARRRRRKGGFDKLEAEDEGDKTDLLRLSEEVIDSIYAGHSVGNFTLSPNASRRSSFLSTKDYCVNVITDVKFSPNWAFDIDPGAWSRILMNLFSNALKYTKVGFVKISLEVEHKGMTRSKKPRNNVLLKVRDSGKGISQEFLKHRLFKPFTQEDSLATGTGLGLSIVRHIIQDLGGTITFTSEQGTGTEAIVRLPLLAQKPVVIGAEEDLVAMTKTITKGYKFCLEGFDRYPDITEAPTGILSAEAKAAMLLKSSVVSQFSDWFGMEKATAGVEAGTDVIVIMEAGIPQNSVKEILSNYDHSKPSKSGKAIAIIVCIGYRLGPKVLTCGKFQLFYLYQPYGPHKLAKFLHIAFGKKSTHNGTPESQIEEPDYKVNGEIQQKLSDDTPKFATTVKYEQTETETTVSPNTTETKDFEPALLSPTSRLSPKIQTNEMNGINGTVKPSIEPTNGSLSPKGLRVLLVEDNEINLKLLVATMRKQKITHSTAMNGLEALNTYKASRGKFDVIFMDISMPVMSGIESSRFIRLFEKEERLVATKLIALTGAANPETRQEAFSVGVDLYLTKPVAMKELKTMLEELRKEICV